MTYVGESPSLDSMSQTLVPAGADLGLSVVVPPAVSSINSVLIDVDYDPASGVRIIEGTTALVRQTRFIPEIAALIFQPGVFGTFYPRLTVDDRRITAPFVL